jgi:FtsH-binding integral membrane protein
MHFIKFIHLLFALGLVGLTASCILSKNIFFRKNAKKILLLMSIFALMTGVLLVYQTPYTFHTPWIQAALILLGIFITGILFSFYKKIDHPFFYSILLILLILISQDAVRKMTFFK